MRVFQPRRKQQGVGCPDMTCSCDRDPEQARCCCRGKANTTTKAGGPGTPQTSTLKYVALNRIVLFYGFTPIA
ncbi:MAG TPA: hypothetical protein DCL83_14080, partial [Arthrobacter bacterium]|nr:hypothetical protein [Arthrobacter sp.]